MIDQLLGSGIATYGSSSSSSDNDNDIEPEILTASIIYEKRTTWEQARCKLMHTKCQAYAISIFRLISIHWFQPIFYWIIFIAYQDNLDENQLVFGYIVGIREIIYIMLTLVCLNVISSEYGSICSILSNCSKNSETKSCLNF